MRCGPHTELNIYIVIQRDDLLDCKLSWDHQHGQCYLTLKIGANGCYFFVASCAMMAWRGQHISAEESLVQKRLSSHDLAFNQDI